MLDSWLEDWMATVLCDVVFNDTTKWDGSSREVPYVGLEHIRQDSGNLESVGNAAEVVSAKNIFKVGDVLFGKLRPNLKKYWHAEFEGICSTDILVLRPLEGILNKYLYYLVQSHPFLSFAMSDAAGTKMPRTSWKRLGGFEFLLPPFSEQERIAEILSSIDDSICTTEVVIAQAERVKCGLMEDLLTGGLGSEAIARGDVPEGYRNINFSNAFVVKNDKRKKIQKSGYSTTGAYPIVDQSIDFIAGYTDGTPNMNFPVVIFGDHTRCVKWIDFPFFTGADGTQALYPSDEIIPKYGFYLIQSAKLPNLGYSRHMRELKRASFVIPQKAIQLEIVEVLDAIENQIKANCKTADKLRRLKHGLMNDLLTGRVRTVS